MAKERQPILDYTIYLAVRGVVCFVQALPPQLGFALAELLAKGLYRFDRRHRRIAAENIRHAFPELAEQPASIDRLVRGCFRHYSLLLIEIILLPRKLRLGNYKKYALLIHGERIVPGLLDDRPLLIVTAHFGNWEIAGYVIGACGFETYAIARVLDNPYLERFFKTFRQATGQTIIAKKADFDRLSKVMRAGGKVATLGDQDAGPRGVFVDFFGRKASAHKAVALMAIEYDALMVVVGTPRVAEPMHYEIINEEVIDPRDYADRSDAVKAITQEYHDALERLIRRYPEQYFWLHRRWKSQPKSKDITMQSRNVAQTQS